jgi:hypothetical protein
MRGLARFGVVFLLFLGVALGLQWKRNAAQSEFGGHPDEAAHYVTGLMVRDFVLHGKWSDPVGFAEQYYVHYPKVAIGHWPPFFYVVQAAWTCVFPTSRPSLMLLMAVLTALLAASLYRAVRPEFGVVTGLALGLVLVALPLVQMYTGMVMAEMLVALLHFWAVLAFGRFLDTGRGRDALLFGVVAALAILTKGNGVALALVPPLAVLLSRRFGLLKRWTFWLPAAVVLVICAPWYVFTMKYVQNTWAEQAVSTSYTADAARYYSAWFIKALGLGLGLLGLLGLLLQVRTCWRKNDQNGKWVSVTAYFVAIVAFQCLVPCGVDERFLIPVLPVVLLAAAPAARWLTSLVLPRRLTAHGAALAAAALLGAVFSLETFTIPAWACHGYGPIARRITSSSEFEGTVLLVSSDSYGEGMLIAEMANDEERPGHVILRGSKVLQSSDWLGRHYACRYRTSGEVMAYLDSIPVGLVIVDSSVPRDADSEDRRLLLEAIRANPSRWESLGTYDLRRPWRDHPHALNVYRLVTQGRSSARAVSIDMRGMLGKPLEWRAP